MGFYRGPNIVTDGLVFAVDAGSERSYPGSGTTTTSLVGSNTGTLSNGVAYSSQNGGAFDFDGIDDYIDTTFTIPAGDRSLEFWVYYNTLTSAGGNSYSLMGVQQPSASYLYSGIQSNGSGYSYAGNTGGAYNYTFSAQTWYHIACVMDSGTARHYVNGVQEDTRAYSSSVASTTEVMIGAINQQHEIDGLVPLTRVYNKALSAEEVLQNFNAQKSRFGL
jgi:hypothetical protein